VLLLTLKSLPLHAGQMNFPFSLLGSSWSKKSRIENVMKQWTEQRLPLWQVAGHAAMP
jgi:hypothetical protein